MRATEWVIVLATIIQLILCQLVHVDASGFPSNSSSTSDVDQPSTSAQLPDSTSPSGPKWSASTQFCESQSCKYFAQTFLSKLDWNSWCCDDFYEFVCSKTLHSDIQNVSPNARHKEAETLTSVSHSETEENVKSLFTTTGRRVKSSANLKRLQNMYQSCENRQENSKAVIDIIQKLGGFPLGGAISGWNDQIPFDWLVTTIKFRQRGLNLDQFFDFGPKSDGKYYRLKIGITKKDSLTNTRKASEIVESLYRQDFDADNMDFQIDEVNKFRSDLRAIMNRPRGSEEKYNFEKLKSTIPQIDWHKLLRGIVSHEEKFVYNPIIIEDREKLEALCKLLVKTNPRILANHMMLGLIDHFGPYMKKFFLGAKKESQPTRFIGPFFKKIPLMDCVQVLKKQLGLALSVDYYHNYVDPDLIAAGNEIVTSLINELKLMIDDSVWIADKPAAQHKIDTLKFDLGVAPELRDPQLVSDLYYKKLELSPTNIFDNLIRIQKVKHSVHFNDLLNEETGKFEWIEYDTELMHRHEAHYNQVYHRIYLPIEFIGKMNLDFSRLDSINFGIFGTKVAHEMIMALGLRQMMKEPAEIKPGPETECSHRVECLKKQYNGLKPDGADWTIEDESTLISNWADNAGVEVAYRALVKYLKASRGRAKLLRGIPLMSKQLFWASYGVSMCRNFNSQRQIDILRYGRHSPPKFRVNIPLGNSMGFSKDFECPIESRMSPLNKCLVWTPDYSGPLESDTYVTIIDQFEKIRM